MGSNPVEVFLGFLPNCESNKILAFVSLQCKPFPFFVANFRKLIKYCHTVGSLVYQKNVIIPFLADFPFVSDKTGVLYAALQDLLAQLTENLSAVPKIISQFVNKLQGTWTFAFLVHLSAAVFLLLLLVLYFDSLHISCSPL